ncbi:MAG: hypothetical protein WCB11_16935 [Terriglobales bacterium]
MTTQKQKGTVSSEERSRYEICGASLLALAGDQFILITHFWRFPFWTGLDCQEMLGSKEEATQVCFLVPCLSMTMFQVEPLWWQYEY